MATIKIVLRKKLNKDGTYPLALRITRDRKTSFIHLKHDLKEKDWDADAQRVKKSHPNSTRLNNLLAAKLAEALNSSLELEASMPLVTAKAVSQRIRPKAGQSVFAQADLFIERLKADGKYNRWNSEKTYVKHLKEFLKTDVSFSELTIKVLERFKASLVSVNKLSERSAINHLVTIRSVFSQAIAEGVCDEKYYPFGKKGIKIKFPDSNKSGLTSAEVTRIEIAELSGKANHARNLWLLSFYFAGIRISDVLRLRWSDFQDGRLYYKMGKNRKGDSLKVSEKSMRILDQYEGDKDEKNDLIFQELRDIDINNRFEMERIIASRNNAIDRILKEQVAPAAKISKPLTMHISRHSFGNISGDKIPVQMLQKLYRHSDLKTTIGYQANFIHGDVDDALEAVLGSN